ncbi:MAG TPA: anthrone oxygenase family protein [Acetobacteraceae bacterium]|nr:anthrone oxygenase family protein [Acetobacteraceae bacterium]
MERIVPMFAAIEVISVFLVSVAMSLALAHALEFPGKLRLDRQTYVAMQPIYYPGFTYGGGIGEGLGMVATLVLLLMTPAGSMRFWWTLGALAALVAMHAAYWIFTHPVNKFWLKDQQLQGHWRGFFGFDPLRRRGRKEPAADDGWERARDRWEYSHVLRAILSIIALLMLTIAVTQ